LNAFKPVSTVENPTLQEAEATIREALARRKCLIVVGNCWVEYHGRASSKLESGERILIVKEDGSLLVHRAKGYEPVNWQPPGCIFQTMIENETLIVKAIRRKPAEHVKVFFNKIYMVSALSLKDTGTFSLYASEEDMQKAILAEPWLVEEGFKPIAYEKKVEPGFVDVYGVDSEGNFVVVEIKRKTAGREAAFQLARYVDAIKGMVNRPVRGILVAPSIAKGVQRTLDALNLSFKALDPRRCAEILKRSETRKLAEFFGEQHDSRS